MAREMGKGMGSGGSLLLGRRTYEDFHEAWASREDPNPFTAVLNETHKLVVSRTLTEPLPWVNSALLAGDGVAAVRALKAQSGPDLMILGSGELVRSLMRHGLVAHLSLLIHPLVLGSGRRLFEDQQVPTSLRLLDMVGVLAPSPADLVRDRKYAPPSYSPSSHQAGVPASRGINKEAA